MPKAAPTTKAYEGGEIVNYLLLAIAIICATGWLANALALRVLTRLMKRKGCTPTSEEVEVCSQETAKHLLTGDRSEPL